MSNSYMQIDPRDNIIVAIDDLQTGTSIRINRTDIEIKERIKGKHKFAMRDLSIGDNIYMYGVLVGKAVLPIEKGRAITTENIKHASADFNDAKEQYSWKAPDISKFEGKKFKGYHRADGSVGTANYWLVIPMVFCENRNIDVLQSALCETLGYDTNKDYTVDTQALVDKYKVGADIEEIRNTSIITTREEMAKTRLFPNVDGIKFLKHEGGCGGIRQDSETLCKLLAGYITHANVSGATVLSLGCQNAQVEMLQNAIKENDPDFSKPLYIIEQQKTESERHLIEQAVKQTFEGLIEADKVTRRPAPLSKLTVGLECGASDGFSGISANPALGYASDLLVALGGTPVLAEFPELNGVEQELVNRSETDESAAKFAKLMKSYSAAAVAVGSGFENNPSPGNIKDGLITDAMKSAGAAKKGGTSPVVDVKEYAEKITKSGLNLLCTPGNDVESTTGLAGSGCNVIVFTTGLGTPTGNPISPVIKLSSNTPLFEKMSDIIDIDAGSIVSGQDTIKSMGEKILDHIIKVASGELVAKRTLKAKMILFPGKGAFHYNKRMKRLNRKTIDKKDKLPLKVMQFGGGNFLRAFVDWIIDILNKKTDFNGGVVIVKPTDGGDYSELKAQDGLFTVVLDGIENGEMIAEKTLVTSVNQVVNSYTEWDAYLKLAENPDLRYIVSNTTEAGIKFDAEDDQKDTPPGEFPAKLTLWLYRRFEHFEGEVSKGCILLPCELIENNGAALEKTVLQYADVWQLGDGFSDWIKNANHFCGTLVDRIVSGYPKDRADDIQKELGYRDELLVAGEQYHSWVIQAPDFVQNELPFSETDLNVEFVDHLAPYREMKVRILNGAHTAMVPVGYLAGIRFVDEAMDDKAVSGFVKSLLLEEAARTLDFSEEVKRKFVADVLDRFHNRLLKHRLISISLNSTSKFTARLLPTLKDYHAREGKLPKRIVFGLAALIRFYKGEIGGEHIPLKDDQSVLDILASHWKKYDSDQLSLNELAISLLSEVSIWKEDLTQIEGLPALVTEFLLGIEKNGIQTVLKTIA